MSIYGLVNRQRARAPRTRHLSTVLGARSQDRVAETGQLSSDQMQKLLSQNVTVKPAVLLASTAPTEFLPLSEVIDQKSIDRLVKVGELDAQAKQQLLQTDVDTTRSPDLDKGNSFAETLIRYIPSESIALYLLMASVPVMPLWLQYLVGIGLTAAICILFYFASEKLSSTDTKGHLRNVWWTIFAAAVAFAAWGLTISPQVLATTKNNGGIAVLLAGFVAIGLPLIERVVEKQEWSTVDALPTND